VFEGDTLETAQLTNWSYVGGPVAGFTEMVAPGGIRIGETRDQLVEAYPEHADYGDEIDVSSPFLEFILDGDAIMRFGVIECVFEASEDD
jgi:hypothetical protein